ncbi:hypothetical protein OH76DRAFT_1406306 [Lentinus brumalis]|uniref:Uncharacterized protein n=1 Tax=Lentinus brumalis TaxID=2498619 RepID=A0A371D3T0_9APHY|nr:hypothetical protein OH76DRAFT_1406306 [Polyporus brumalis]
MAPWYSETRCPSGLLPCVYFVCYLIDQSHSYLPLPRGTMDSRGRINTSSTHSWTSGVPVLSGTSHVSAASVCVCQQAMFARELLLNFLAIRIPTLHVDLLVPVPMPSIWQPRDVSLSEQGRAPLSCSLLRVDANRSTSDYDWVFSTTLLPEDMPQYLDWLGRRHCAPLRDHGRSTWAPFADCIPRSILVLHGRVARWVSRVKLRRQFGNCESEVSG